VRAKYHDDAIFFSAKTAKRRFLYSALRDARRILSSPQAKVHYTKPDKNCCTKRDLFRFALSFINQLHVIPPQKPSSCASRYKIQSAGLTDLLWDGLFRHSFCLTCCCGVPYLLSNLDLNTNTS
jgi:hypothetical protein